MPREKLVAIQPRSTEARRLQKSMLAYHDFRASRDDEPLRRQIDELGLWQSRRLKETHRDLYLAPQYHDGLDFLLEDLYNPRAYNRRDEDFERVFPTMVRLLPDSVLAIAADLVELNLLTQQLDRQLAEVLHHDLQASALDCVSYAEAFRRSAEAAQRYRQIELVAVIGENLQRYVDRRSLRVALRMTEGAAEMAGVGELHRFLTRGFRVFREMRGVDRLLERIVRRESWILEQIMAGHPLPTELPETVR